MHDERRLRWRCRRGLLELDLLLAAFLQREYAALDAEERAAFAALVELQDPELWQRVNAAPEAPADTPQARVLARLRQAARPA